MLATKARFRTSRIAQKAYVGAIVFGLAIWGCMEAQRSMAPQVDEQPVPQGPFEHASQHNRKLLSGGVELIPGFTGAKCGSNWYHTPTGGCKASCTDSNDCYGDGDACQGSGTCNDPYTKCTEHKYKYDTWSKWDDAQVTKLFGSASQTSVTTQSLNLKKYAEWEANGGSVLYVILSIYLFLGIAIICDGAFTSSLEMICSRYGLDLPNDVAGATFMAAGSSAPELATSFMGVFVAKSAVGLGTILGSAVFNILIIVGAVAILTGKPLALDYRPVIRDNFFYGVSVILLCVVVAVDDQANLIDTVVLLLWYSSYIVFLAFNDPLMHMMGWTPPPEVEEADLVDPCAGKCWPFCPDPPADDDEGGAPSAPDDIDTPMTPTMGDVKLEDRMPDVREEAPAPAESDAPADIIAEQAAASVSDEEGGDDAASPGDVQMDDLGGEAAAKEEDDDEPKKGKKQASFSTQRWNTDAHEEDPNQSCFLKWCCCQEDLPPMFVEESENYLDWTLDIFSYPFRFIFTYTMPNCHMDFDEDEEDEWHEKYEAATPEERKAMKEEMMAGLTCQQKSFWITFFISLLHISWLSFFMVEFMLKIGCLWGIDDVVMGLTFLAMGTSIPDALGSISVAADGEGDMAVSNAVGSNVFDICIGLGLPWFIKLCIDAGNDCDYIPIWKASEDVIPSIVILMGIIVILFSTFYASNWKLFPWVGWVLFGVYGLFVAQALVMAAVEGETICTDKCC